MFSFNNISNGFGATENGQHNLKVSTYGMPVVKVEKSEPSCNTFKPYQTTALPPKSIFDVHSLRGLDTQDDVLKIQITNVQGATSDENIDKHQTPVNQKFNQVNSDQLMQSTFHVGIQEKYPMPERVPRRQLSKIIPEKKFALKTKMRSLQNQTNGKPPVQGEIGLQKAELPFQLNSEESEIGLVPSRLLRDQPDIRQMRPQFPTSAYQTNSAMPGDQVNTRVTFSSYQNGTPDSMPSPHVSTSMAAYEINSTMSAHQVNARGSLSPYQNGTPDRYKNGTPVSAPSPHVSTSMAAYEANSVMSAHEVDSRGTLSPYQNGTPEDSVSSPHDQISTSITPSSALMSSHVAVPLFHMEKSPTSQTDNSMKIPPPLVYLNSNATVPLYHLEEKPLSQSEDGEKNVSFKANYLAGMSKYFGDFYFQDFPQGMPFWPTEIRDMVPDPQRSSRGCNCCCHGQDPKNQRPSVIMVPASRSSRSISDSATSHLPLKVDTTSHKHYSEGHWPISEGGPHQVHYLSDSGSSDDENGKEKYFRKNIDGTTTRFKLSKEEWARIPINTFPSGGRLLSGDWTRIFLSKVKESNPWCSLRFKNNHVRSENSRKIHSAVFFRGGAECKRPECNVKVRFVIRKEKGKHVDVTYVGNVCHNSEPTVSDVISNRKRVVNRVRRTYST